jgi:hypothetical protein
VRRLSLILALMVIAMGASHCTHAPAIDTAMGAQEAGDFTALIEGCGGQPIPGYTYCRVMEGDSANVALTFIFPPTQCKPWKRSDGSVENRCAFWKVFFPGTQLPALGDGVAPGVTAVTVQWSDIIKDSQFRQGYAAYWPILFEIHFTDKDGRDRVSFADGELRLRVLKKGYISLQSIKDDPAFAWVWSMGRHVFKMTTGARVYVGSN